MMALWQAAATQAVPVALSLSLLGERPAGPGRGTVTVTGRPGIIPKASSSKNSGRLGPRRIKAIFQLE